MVLWRKRQENIKEGNAIKHISLKTLKRILWLLFLYIIVVFPSCFDTRRNLIYMLYLEWYDVKLIEKSWSFQKQCVFPLFSEKKKKHLQKLCKCLIIKVDQPGLEPGTSRLWVCCSNQLSYKSDTSTPQIWRICACKSTKKWRNSQISTCFFLKNARKTLQKRRSREPTSYTGPLCQLPLGRFLLGKLIFI